MKKIMVFILMFSLLITISQNVFAANKTKEDDWSKRRAFLEENMIKMGSQGSEKVDKWLAANGVVKDEKIESNDAQISSSPGTAKVYNMAGYYDTIAKKYLVKGWWTWNSIQYPDLTTGALEGISLIMAQTNYQPVTGYIYDSNPAGIAVYDQDGTYYSTSGNASSINQSGVAYTFQDAWQGTKYVGYKGQAWYWLVQRPTQSPIYIKMDYQHTWTSASLSSFGVNWQYPAPPELQMTFSPVPSSWKITDQITDYSWY